MSIPKKYLAFVGQQLTLGGGLFSGQRREPPLKYEILDIRAGQATVVYTRKDKTAGTLEILREHPTYELLVKRRGMARARWTRPFPIKEIDLRKKRVK